MTVNMGRGILAPRSGAVIRDGAAEMRTLGATAAAAINDTELRVSGELATKIGKIEAYENLVPRDEAVRYGIPGPRGRVGPASEVPGPPGPGGSIALEETDPGCFVDSEITWLQWDTSVGTVARAWNPNTETYQMIHGDTGLRRVDTVNGQGFGYIRRIGNQVSVYFRDVIAPTGDIYVLPTGFRPDVVPQYGFLGRTGGRALATFTVAGGGSLTQGTSHDITLYFSFTFNTNNAWPASLPGTPV